MRRPCGNAPCKTGMNRRNICRRILIAQSLYAAGAALRFVGTSVSIAAIVRARLNFALAPGLRRKPV